MATEPIDIVIREDGSRVVKRSLDDIAKAATNSATSVEKLNKTLGSRLQTRGFQNVGSDMLRVGNVAKQFTSELGRTNTVLQQTAGSSNLLRNAFIALGGAAAIHKVIELADAYTNLQNKIRLTTKSNDELNVITDKVFEIANRTRQSYEAVGTVYTRTAAASKTLGLSQQDLLDFTESLNKTIALSGATSTEAAQGMIQLSQGMGRGVLQGQDLKAVLEDIPAVGDVIAKGLGTTRLALAKLGAEGKITGSSIIKAFQKSREEINEKFAKSIPTIGQAFTVLNNQLGRMVGETGKASGASTALARTLISISDHLPEIARGFAVIAAGALVAFAPGIYNSAASAIARLTGIIAANPFGALAVAITVAVTAITLFRDQIVLVEKDSITLGDYMRALWEGIRQGIYDVLGYFEALGRVPGMIGEQFTALRLFFKEMFAELKQLVNDFVNSLQTLGEAAGALYVNLGKYFKGKLSIGELGSAIGDAFAKHVETDVVANVVKDANGMLDNLTARARKFALERQAAEKKTPVDLTTKGKPIAHAEVDKKALAELKRLKTALRGVIEEANPTDAAIQHLAQAYDILERSVRKGLITEEYRAEILGKLTDKYRDIIDPIGALNRELLKEVDLSTLSTKQREVETSVMQVQQTLKAKGVALTEQELQGYREVYALIQANNTLNQNKEQILDSLQGKQKEFVESQAALNDLLREGSISLTEFNQAMIALKVDTGNATFSEGFIGQLEVMQRGMDHFTVRAAEQFSKLTDSMIDGFAEATARSIVFGDSFTESLGKAADQALAGLIAGLIKIGLQMIINAALGRTLGAASTASGITMAGATAAAWAPAAAAASLASFGSNSPPAIAGMTSAYATSKALSLTGFKTGGEFTVGGAGGPDSQLVAFRATPGESVRVNTPAQAKAAEGKGDTQVNVPVRVVNVLDPTTMIEAMRTRDGERLILNTIQSNPAAIRRIING